MIAFSCIERLAIRKARGLSRLADSLRLPTQSRNLGQLCQSLLL